MWPSQTRSARLVERQRRPHHTRWGVAAGSGCSVLAVAQSEGRLQRNFQGYSTHAECDMVGFGVSAIGRVGPTYSQNLKNLDSYYAALD